MKNLEKEYDVYRFDIKTNENKILQKYTDTIKSHKYFDIRLQEAKSDNLLIISEYSIQKIFSLLEEFPEEHILFLYLGDKRKDNNKPNKLLVCSPSEIKETTHTYDSRIDINGIEAKLESFIENKFQRCFYIFSILYYMIAGLLLIHLLKFLLSKEVT